MDRKRERKIRKSLAAAIGRDDREEVEKILQNGGRVNMYIQTSDDSTTRYTLLGAAISVGATAVFDYLLEQDADVNKILYRSSDTEREEFFPLQLACVKGRVDMIPRLVEKGANIHARIEGVVLVEEEGASLHYTGDGDTNLHWAVLNSRMPELLALLDNGADPHIKNNRSETPFALACYLYKPDFIEVLCRVGGAVEVQDIFGDTPLDNLLNHGEGDLEENCNMIKLALHAGYKPSLYLDAVLHRNSSPTARNREHLLREIGVLYGETFVEWLRDWFFQVKSLKCTCRAVIREAIGSGGRRDQGFERKIHSLYLPGYFKDYLLLKTDIS